MQRLLGWIGVIMINGQSAPAIYSAITTGQAMPVNQWLTYFVGLLLLYLQAVKDKDPLYIASNMAGLIGLSILALVAYI